MNNINEILEKAPPLDVLREGMDKLEGRYEAKPFIAETDYQRAYVERVKNERVPVWPIDEALFFRAVGEEMVKRNFVLRPEQKMVVHALANYFSGNAPKECAEKGVFLFGGTGSGKTTLMKIFQSARARFGHPLAMVNFPALHLDMLGEQRTNLEQQRQLERIFDDAGAESPEVSSYGNKINVLPYLLMLRYDSPYRTHITSNLTPDEIILRPGFDDRVKSRMNELFNIVHLPGGDFRRLMLNEEVDDRLGDGQPY